MRVEKTIWAVLVFCSGFFNGYAFEISPADSLNKDKGDTILTGFQYSRPGTGPFFYKQTLGNLGSAFHSVNFWDERKEFFNSGMNAFKIYEFSEVMNFNLPKRKTFSELRFINGSKKEQNFSIKHFQRVTNEISAGLDFGIAHSDGYYSNQVSNLRNFNVYAAFQTKNERYHLLANYLSNRIISQENGGLENDTAFELTGSFDSKVAAVNFTDVKSRQKSKIFFAEQRFNFYSCRNKTALMNDSLDAATDSINVHPDFADASRNHFYLKHTFKYERRSALFTADRFYSNFFENAYYDTTRTDDSLFVRDFFNELSLNVEGISILKGKTAFYLAGNHQYFGFYEVDTVNPLFFTDTVLRNFSVKPAGSIQWENGLGADFYFEKSFNNLASDFYKAAATVHYDQKKKNRIMKLSFEKERRNPDFIYTYYNSNHFIWYNQLAPVDISKLEFSEETKFSRQFLKIRLGYFSVKSLTYFDEQALPQQFHDNINVISFDLFHSIRFGKFNLVNDFLLQRTDEKEIVRLPLFSSYSSLYYDDNFFKRALYAQFGVDVRYCTWYFADAYMPATGQFYLQDEKEIGNYAYVDVFANFRIKTFRFFLKLEHLNAGFTERVYYTVPHYPMPGRTFKFGVSWQFLNDVK